MDQREVSGMMSMAFQQQENHGAGDTVEVLSCRAPSTRGPPGVEEQVQKARCRGRGRRGPGAPASPVIWERVRGGLAEGLGLKRGGEGDEVGNEKSLSGGGGDMGGFQWWSC